MNTESELAPVGVIVARFQVPDLHAGHRYLIEYVLDRHHDVLIILGQSYSATDHNALSFEMRKGMVESTYPREQCPGRNILIVPLGWLPSSHIGRSAAIDRIISDRYPGRPAMIYGSRDSVIQKYNGKFPTCEVPTVFAGSATEIRESIKPINSRDFRAGVIYATVNRKPSDHPTVDVAIVDRADRRVLLVGKRIEDGKLRFPGVYYDPQLDQSYEGAAQRCIRKELPTIAVESLCPIGSYRVADPRYARTKEGVITLFMSVDYVAGEASPGDGVQSAGWVGIDDLLDVLVDGHLPLGEAVQKVYVKV